MNNFNLLDHNILKKTDVDLASIVMEVVPKAIRVIRAENRSHRGENLKLIHMRVLANVWRKKITNKELAETIGLSPAAMSRVVQSLAKRRLLVCVKNPLDRREHFIEATKEGFELFKGIRRQTTQRLSQRFLSLSHKERNTIAEGLKLLEEALSTFNT
jgi:DNA-binding MarR family transcriptional regulator